MRSAGIVLAGFSLLVCLAGPSEVKQPTYKVLPALTHDNLSVFPIVADKLFDTSEFLTLDEGIRSGQVTVAEMGRTTGLVRPRHDGGVWQEHPFPYPPRPRIPPPVTAQVNSLALVNNSDRPMILLAGEIVTGGKQDRVVGKDRIIPPHSEPVSLDVFCVEPGRWMGASLEFGATASVMAQPSVRVKAMAEQNQAQVWDEVAKSRSAFVAALPAAQAAAVESNSSYAKAVQNGGVGRRLDEMAVPIEQSYGKLLQQLRSQKAAGAVVAVNGQIIWADVFASSALLEKYWPKLIRSYAAEAVVSRREVSLWHDRPSQESAQAFLDHLYGRHEKIESEPGVYRNTEIEGDGFRAFLLTSLLPNTSFPVHLAKMQQ